MSPESDSSLERLSWQSKEILKAVQKAGGDATTTRVRESSSLRNNEQITYRFRETSELDGLAEISQPESAGGRIPAKRITLTEQGGEIAGQLLDTQEQDVTLEYLAAKFDQLLEDINTAQDRLDDLEQQIGTGSQQKSSATTEPSAELEELNDKLDAQQEQLSDLVLAVSSIEENSLGGWSDDEEEQYDELWKGMSVFRQYLQEQVDPLVERDLSAYREEAEEEKT